MCGSWTLCKYKPLSWSRSHDWWLSFLVTNEMWSGVQNWVRIKLMHLDPYLWLNIDGKKFLFEGLCKRRGKERWVRFLVCAMLPLTHGCARGCWTYHGWQQRWNHIDEIKRKITKEENSNNLIQLEKITIQPPIGPTQYLEKAIH